MLDFSRAYGHSIHLSVPDGQAALLLLDVPGAGLVRISLQQGARLGATDTVSGRLLAAFGCLESACPRSQATRIQRRGYELAESSHAIGITDIGVPVYDGEARVIAALAVPVLRTRKGANNTEALVAPLKECAQRIASAL